MSRRYSNEELLQCVKRELAYRKKVYRGLVARGQMNVDEALEQIALMVAIVDHFEALVQPKLL